MGGAPFAGTEEEPDAMGERSVQDTKGSKRPAGTRAGDRR